MYRAMKRFNLLILVIPQVLFAQYQSKEFTLSNERNTNCQAVGITATRDSVVTLNLSQPVSGLFISGTTTLGNMLDSYARITIKDRNETEYLVYENYPLLSDGNTSRFSKVAVESVLLDDIVPTSMTINVYNASVRIDSIYYSAAQNPRQSFPARARAIRMEQTQAIVDRLNAHLRENRMPWFADCTSIALKTFEERKQMFGPKVPCLHGFDYYKGGLYVASPDLRNVRSLSFPMTSSSTFVRDFDWRNRHGKNWITSVKDQGSYGTCWAHATTATIESNFNIYFNQTFPDSINDLSEQELVSCLDNDGQNVFSRVFYGGDAMYALDYVQRKGIVRDNCFPFIGAASCEGKCDPPEEKVSFSSFRNIVLDNIFDDSLYQYSDSISCLLRKSVIKSPVVIEFNKAGKHAVSCVGFHQIQMGDTICSSINTSYFFVVDSATSHFVDMISWTIKNSWGDDWGENGYANVSFYTVILKLYELSPPYTSLIYSDADRCVTDDDMDGYYTWGSGTKPANLPVWIPDEQDGDDSNPSIGAIDEYGNCDTLTVTPAVTWYINSNISHNATDSFTYPNIVVLQGGTLTITDAAMTMKRNATVRVQSGGRLVINGGQILEADIVVESGGTLIIDHGGLVQLRHNGQYLTQIGAKVSMYNGKINYTP